MPNDYTLSVSLRLCFKIIVDVLFHFIKYCSYSVVIMLEIMIVVCDDAQVKEQQHLQEKQYPHRTHDDFLR